MKKILILLPAILIIAAASHAIAAPVGNGTDNDDNAKTDTKTVAAAKNGSEEVVASGVGKDEKSALKDAFRNAVEQVVGMVVDSTVQAKNDEIIRDQILTASDGFITEYKTILSEVQDGLTRVRIKAVVERKSLVQKLEAKQVIVKKVDLGNLFAKVASDAQAVEGATKILCERLTEFHKVWTAKAGEPNYDRNSGVMSIPLTISADPSAYAASATRLAEVLDKISIRKSRKLLTSIETSEKDGKRIPPRKIANFASTTVDLSKVDQFDYSTARSTSSDQHYKWKGYKITEWLKAGEYDELPKSAFWIWLCVSDKNLTTEWTGYAIDANFDKIGPLLFPKWSVSMVLRDENAAAISSYELSNLTFESHYDYNADAFLNGVSYSQMGMHLHLIRIAKNPQYLFEIGDKSGLRLHEDNNSIKDGFIAQTEGGSLRFQCLIAPNFTSIMKSMSDGNNSGYTVGNFAYWKQEVVTATFKISPDEIKNIKKTEISITAEPRTIKTK